MPTDVRSWRWLSAVRAGVWQRFRRAERGSQTIEWVGIGAVVVALVAAVIGFVPEIGAAVAAAFTTVLEEVVGGE